MPPMGSRMSCSPRAPRASGWDGQGQAFPDFNQHHPLSATLMSAPDSSEFQSTHPGNGNRACPAQSKSSLTMNSAAASRYSAVVRGLLVFPQPRMLTFPAPPSSSFLSKQLEYRPPDSQGPTWALRLVDLPEHISCPYSRLSTLIAG